MKLPRSLEINGRKWAVRRMSLVRKGVEGECDYRKREIRIERNLPAAEVPEVFLHEILHACLPEETPSRTEEAMVLKLAPRLLEVLRNIGYWAK